MRLQVQVQDLRCDEEEPTFLDEEEPWVRLHALTPIVSTSGKVLHVLVEVRSVPEREGKGARDVEAVDSATPPQEEVQMQFGLNPRGSAVPGTGTPPGGRHAVSSHSRGRGGSFSPSKSSCTSCQQCLVGDPDDSSSTFHRQSLPLSAALNPTTNGESIVMSHSSECETCQGQSPWSSPASSRGPSLGSGEGRRSVVTFSYIEKASVRTVESPRNAPCRSALDHPTDSPYLRRSTEGSPLAAAARLCKGMSSPVYFYSPESSCNSSLALSFRAPGAQRVDPLCFIARASTQRELEEFGSPQLKRRAADSPAGWHQEQPRCQSWAGSPVPSRGAGGLPKTRQGDPDWLKPPCDLPRNSTKKQPSARTACQSTATMPTFRTDGSQEAQSPAQWQGGDEGPVNGPCLARRVSLPPGYSLSIAGRGMNQLSGSKVASPANSPQTAPRLAKEDGRLSAVLWEVRRPPSPGSQGNALGPSSPRQGCLPQEWQQCPPPQDGASPANCHTTMNIPVSLVPGPDSSVPAGSGRGPAFPARDTELAEEVPAGSPALPARLNRFALYPVELASPLRDPRLQTALLKAADTPTLHRHQFPQYKGENWSPDPEYEWGDSPESVVRLYVGQRGGIPDTDAPVSWTSRQQWGGLQGTGSDSPKVSQWADRCLGSIPPILLQKEAERWTREALLLGPVTLDDHQGGRGRDGPALGCWSVPPNADEEQQPDECYPNCGGDRGSTSSESTLSSHRSYEMGHAASGIQSDSGVSSMGSSLRSQKIARAKWEFLFGTPSTDSTSAGSKDNPDASTAPPSGTSSESPTPTPPTSLPLEGQRSASHDVQQVELELVMEAGASPKTGIIRRTIKYSETDLDAIPLRCYRETDIDEVLADQDEADSAFGSNRSVPGTPGSSPLGGAPYERTDGEEEEEEEGREVDVVSWARVRRQGDRKRHHGTPDEGEVFSLLLKRPLDGFLHCHPALKSPILVSGPRLTSEDTFSRHFESIMESHRAKGTSYCSLNSVDLLTSSGQSVFTFDLPTLTPEVQGQTYQSAREIVGLSFAPLARRETPSASEYTLAALDSDATRAPSSERLSSCSEDTPSWGWYSALSPRSVSAATRPPARRHTANQRFSSITHK
ncbi:hypothetical protein AAFF_G00381630 [Aldrovandia affinis]|uniref:Uncharacterized protein n=1 Tax=Aldrovandia affinis TaxID=143900 RepID=A0AAD7X043_9TELE|nr:hypothetical protein AAFF_G00381630 [Aldrovandia affinis]